MIHIMSVPNGHYLCLYYLEFQDFGSIENGIQNAIERIISIISLSAVAMLVVRIEYQAIFVYFYSLELDFVKGKRSKKKMSNVMSILKGFCFFL